MTNAEIHGACGTLLPRIHHVGEVTSALDYAHKLAKSGLLVEWDSVLAQSQTAGRGQMRRVWVSPPGNLYAALRLPHAAPFDTAPAAIAMGALLAVALSDFGCKIRLKWPNDLVLVRKNFMGKLGGILLEENQDVILAGIGLNLLCTPECEGPGSSLPAASLVDACVDVLPATAPLWQAIVKHIHSLYKNAVFFSHIWKNLADELLLWRNELVEVTDGGETASGIFLGMSDDGCAMLEANGSVVALANGAMRPVPLA